MNEERTNWAGNLIYRGTVVAPRSVAELQETIARAERMRPLGTRHAFNEIADTEGTLVSTECLNGVASFDGERVTVEAGVSYEGLAVFLSKHARALPNLASLPHISVPGAAATGTHGSGNRQPGLASSVVALEIVQGNGELIRLDGGDPRFSGAVVNLGALGVVARVTLVTEPFYEVRQNVFEGLPFPAALEHFDAITGAGDSVSLFTRWRDEGFDQVWVKRRAGYSGGDLGPELFGARAAEQKRHPIITEDPENCTEQMGQLGPWYDRIPHFRIGHKPSAGANSELQSEYIVPRETASDALRALFAQRGDLSPLTQVTEVRTIAADDLWMSPFYGRESVGIHFTWVPDWGRVRAVLPEVEKALAPFGARPHWGKLFLQGVDGLYPRREEFRALVREFDPTGKFRNAFLDRVI